MGMQHVISVIAAAAALAAPQTGITVNAPVAISTCAASDLYNSALMVEFGLPPPSRMLQLSFVNTDDTIATQVTFDVTRDGAHTVVTDRGRFSKGVSIDRLFDGLGSSGSDAGTSCSVATITFADGRRWIAPSRETKTAATLR